MFGTTSKSLVLRGVSVLRDGGSVGSRLDFGPLAVSQPPEVRISVRPHDDTGLTPEPERRDQAANRLDNHAALRAGRPVRHAGAFSPRTPAMSAGQAVQLRRPQSQGATPAAAENVGPFAALFAASAGKRAPWRPCAFVTTEPAIGYPMRRKACGPQARPTMGSGWGTGLFRVG